ncbi:Exoglucanase 1 [Colletotrichum sidae]|uniref:cellulose 1,4-beta-cellobiosidase (non-reducing end) n=1 Tax=Colletotrichum sidae TaxID=1347389 RepID=A0A4R8TST6_9PEZI|nr:Exoglucanase 1 [Colletotrichum sidae]
MRSLTILLAAISAVTAQQAGTQQTETHPKLTWQQCTASSCTNVNGEVVIDANWRWLHDSSGANCYDGNKWTNKCSTAADCASKCAVEGADYAGTYGATTSGNALSLKFVTQHAYGKNIGSRLYLMNSATKYQMFTLTGNELAFDVDLSQLDCGLNGALYFVQMDEDGGMAKYSTNKAGAKYGTGYCDAQCARDLKFVGGKANVEGWVPSSNDANAGVGPYGACCAEMDVWESNAHSFAVTPHPCQNNAYHVCEKSGCGGTYSDDRFAGDCDANGCDFNPYRMGATSFYGKGKTVDTSSKFTVVTQFSNNKVAQYFVQNGKKIQMPNSSVSGVSGNAVTPDFCTAQFKAFGDRDRFSEVGGWSKLNSALGGKWVLVMSLWDDHYANMLWLDSTYPPEKAGQPGAARGDCPTTSGVPADVESRLASDLHEFLRYLYARPEEEAVEIFKRLRMSGDALQVLEFVRSGDLLLQGRPAEQSASPGDSAMTNSDGDGDVRAAGLTVPASPWTTLANDGVVSELMASFFAWDEPFYLAFVDRESFLEDMRHASAETTEFCSPALVNAICALRSALLILHVSAAADGTDRAGRLFLLAAHDMAQRLVLPAVGGSEGQQRRRRVYSKALWGMYTFESIFSFMYLRPPLFARPSMLRLFLDDVPSDSREDGTQSRKLSVVLNAACDLSIIYNEAMQYNKRVNVGDLGSHHDIQKRVELFAKLRSWRESISYELHDGEVGVSAYHLRRGVILCSPNVAPELMIARAYEDQVMLSIFRPLRDNVRLPEDGYVADLLLAYCERSISGIETYEQDSPTKELSGMVLHPLYNTVITTARFLHLPKSHELFSRACRLLRDRASEYRFVGFLFQGVLAIAAGNGEQIPEMAKSSFKGLQLDETTLKDVPISFVLPFNGERKGQKVQEDGGIHLGDLISNWSWLSITD